MLVDERTHPGRRDPGSPVIDPYILACRVLTAFEIWLSWYLCMYLGIASTFGLLWYRRIGAARPSHIGVKADRKMDDDGFFSVEPSPLPSSEPQDNHQQKRHKPIHNQLGILQSAS